ncbi:hypothetical protein LCGC14_2204230, partial [marine sediment metagenome]
MNPLIVDLDSPMVSWYTISAMRNKYDLQKVRDVSDVDAAWTAGYIDGEGSIGVNINLNRKAHYYYRQHEQGSKDE